MKQADELAILRLKDYLGSEIEAKELAGMLDDAYYFIAQLMAEKEGMLPGGNYSVGNVLFRIRQLRDILTPAF